MTHRDRADHDDFVIQPPDAVEAARRAWRARCETLVRDALTGSRGLDRGLRDLHDAAHQSHVPPGYEVWKVQLSLTPNHRDPGLGMQYRTLLVGSGSAPRSEGRLCAIGRSVASLPRPDHEDPNLAPHEQPMVVWNPAMATMTNAKGVTEDDTGMDAAEALLALLDACNETFPQEMSSHSLERFTYAEAIVNLAIDMIFVELLGHEGQKLELHTQLGWGEQATEWGAR